LTFQTDRSEVAGGGKRPQKGDAEGLASSPTGRGEKKRTGATPTARHPAKGKKRGEDLDGLSPLKQQAPKGKKKRGRGRGESKFRSCPVSLNNREERGKKEKKPLFQLLFFLPAKTDNAQKKKIGKSREKLASVPKEKEGRT